MSAQVSAAHARSLLFVPGDRPERFDKALATGSDCVIIDLEDAVAAESKRAALANAIGWLRGGGRAVVRINAFGTSWHEHEIEALASTDAIVMLPKAESPDVLGAVADRLGDMRLIALVETALGVRDVDALASVQGVSRLALGNVDLAAELGTDPASHAALAYARGRMVMASAAARIAPPVDGVTTWLDAPERLAVDLSVARELGFGGKLCIHPRQVKAVNEALRPSEDEIAWAEKVVAASSSTSGVGVLDGLMIDPPVVSRAEGILVQADR